MFRETLIAYLVAVFLSLALVWFEATPALNRRDNEKRPAIVRVFDGARVVAWSSPYAFSATTIGLLLEGRLSVSVADPFDSLFPRTARWLRLEAPVAILN